jgi:ADP-ribose pyrophosphatase
MKEILFANKNFAVVRDLELDSALKEYIEQPNVVIAVPQLDDGSLVLVEHKRPILGAVLLECPGGKVDAGEDLQLSITRELEEEIGYTPGHLQYVCCFYTSVGSSTEKIHVFFASDLRPHIRKSEDKRKMELSTVSIDEVRALLTDGRIHDGKTLIALMKFVGSVPT